MDVQAWLTANWQYALAIAVIGLVLGWLITYSVMNGKNKKYEASISDLNTKMQKNEKELADTRVSANNMKADMSASEVRLNTAQGPVSYTHLDVYKRQVVRFPVVPGYCPLAIDTA